MIGVGINVNQRQFPGELAGMAASLCGETDKVYRRSEIIAAVMERFEKNYETFLVSGDLSGLKKAYDAVLVNCGQEVKVLEPGNEYIAVAEGIDQVGELIVRLPDGQRRRVFAGDVSVRGIYGYV